MNKYILLSILLITAFLFYLYKINYIYSTINDEEYYHYDEYHSVVIGCAKVISYIYNICIPEKKVLNTHNVPKYIWQTYKTKDLPIEAISAQKTWIKKNPSWKVMLYDDNDIEKYIIEYWGDRMLLFYKNLKIGAMKADLWRYLILTTHGGVYTDIDTVCNRSIDTWISDYKLTDKKDILLISIEPTKKVYCQWTILSTQNHPAMKHVCQYILLNYEKNGINYNDKHFVFNTTGPSIWSNAIINYLELDSLSVSEIYDYYYNNKEIESKGIFITPSYTFSIIYVTTLIGSSMFENNYKSWRVQQDKLIKKAKS